MGKTIQAISVIVTHRNDAMSGMAPRPQGAKPEAAQQSGPARPRLRALARTEASHDQAPSSRIGMPEVLTCTSDDFLVLFPQHHALPSSMF